MRLDRLRRLRRVARWASVLALVAVGCDDPVGPLGGITAESTVDAGHSHRATVPQSDIDSPPSGGGTYVSTMDSGHSHLVHLSAQQLRDLQQHGTSVAVESEGPAPPIDSHTHLFTFGR